MALYDGPQPSPSPGKKPVSKEEALQNIISGLKSGGTGTVGPTARDPIVFMGWGQEIRMGPLPPTRQVMTSTLSAATNMYYTWDAATKDKFMAQAGLAGYDVNNMRDSQLAGLWGAYVQQAASYYAAGVRLSPWDIMSKDMASREAAVAKPRTVTQTSKSFDLSTEGDAKAIFLTAAQQLLGRDPTKSETKKFQAALNAMEKANPTITTTTSNYLGSELQGQESTTTGGVKEGSRQVLAMEEAKKDPEYGAYQAATTYFDALMDAIGGM